MIISRQIIDATLCAAMFATMYIPAGAAERPGAPAKMPTTAEGSSSVVTGVVNDAWFRKDGVDVALSPMPSYCNFGSRFMSANDPTVVNTLLDLLVIQRAMKVTVFVEVQGNWCYITQVNAIAAAQ
jgi:hypothetical protein